MRRIRCLTEGRRGTYRNGLRMKPHFTAAIAVFMVAGVGLLGAASAAACTFQWSAGGAVNLFIRGWDDAEQDKLMGRWTWAGSYHFLEGCTPGAVVPFDVTAELPDLEFVRNVSVDGVRYPAYGLRAYARSPLLIFRHVATDIRGGGPNYQSPLDIAQANHIPSLPMNSSGRGSYVLVAAVSRGGSMESVPPTLLGSIRQVSALYPAWIKTDTFTVTVDVKVPTCTFADTPITLQDVSAADLPAAGSTAGGREFDVVMTCNGEFPLMMNLTDANAAGNSGSRLAPTSNATAAGVNVQLLREGIPVVLGQAWPIAQSQQGSQNIALSARYYREAGTFHAGVVEGQAVITATYR